MTTSSPIAAESSVDPMSGCFGDCEDCGCRHQLPLGRARDLATAVIREFEEIRRLDYRVAQENADPRLALANVIRPGHGNMFGVMECEDETGASVVLRAFSSLREGIRDIDGWVLPLLSFDVYDGTILPAQQEIKRLTDEMNAMPEGSAPKANLREDRKNISQLLWEEMCAAYRFRNFRGEERTLDRAALSGTAITGGMGECCAPKLLNHAAQHGLKPLSIAEFYWGEGNQRGRLVSKAFYPSCEARCQPLLGFMLCGLTE
jgi:hypothetical protein